MPTATKKEQKNGKRKESRDDGEEGEKEAYLSLFLLLYTFVGSTPKKKFAKKGLRDASKFGEHVKWECKYVDKLTWKMPTGGGLLLLTFSASHCPFRHWYVTSRARKMCVGKKECEGGSEHTRENQQLVRFVIHHTKRWTTSPSFRIYYWLVTFSHEVFLLVVNDSLIYLMCASTSPRFSAVFPCNLRTIPINPEGCHFTVHNTYSRNPPATISIKIKLCFHHAILSIDTCDFQEIHCRSLYFIIVWLVKWFVWKYSCKTSFCNGKRSCLG